MKRLLTALALLAIAAWLTRPRRRFVWVGFDPGRPEGDWSVEIPIDADDEIQPLDVGLAR